MVWSYSGTEFSARTKHILTKYQPGALIAFRRNITTADQISRFNSQVQRFAKRHLAAPLLLMVDQEGGVVSRVRTSAPLPSALALGQTNRPDLVEEYGRAKGELLNSLGFNMNLAPVLDISDPQTDTALGSRVFGGTSEAVSKMAMSYVSGLIQMGIVPTAKHFPGLGNTLQDSHRTTPRKMLSRDELDSDLQPFKKFADLRGQKAIMAAHLSLPLVDNSGRPATYSPVILQEILRTDLGFEGVIISDDLEMHGASTFPDIGERAVQALLAGNDMLILAGHPNNQRKAYNAVLKAAREGRISQERLDASVDRIMNLKRDLKTVDPIHRRQNLKIALKKLEKISREVFEQNFKNAMSSQIKQWPATNRRTRAVVFSASHAFYYNFKKSFNGRAIHYHLNPESLHAMSSTLAQPNVQFGVYYASGARTARHLRNLTPALREKLIVVNCNHPGKIENRDMFLGVVDMNTLIPMSGHWLGQALAQPPETNLDLRTPATQDEFSTGD